MVKPALTPFSAFGGLVSCNSCCFLVGGGVFAVVPKSQPRAMEIGHWHRFNHQHFFLLRGTSIDDSDCVEDPGFEASLF